MISLEAQQAQETFLVRARDHILQARIAMLDQVGEIRRSLIIAMLEHDAESIHAGDLVWIRSLVDTTLSTAYVHMLGLLQEAQREAIALGEQSVLEILRHVKNDLYFPEISGIIDDRDPQTIHLLQTCCENLERVLMGIFYEGVLQGYRTVDISTAIVRIIPPREQQFSWRFVSIARTEVGKSLSIGTQAQLETAALVVPKLAKEWRKEALPGSRSEHVEANGQTVPVFSSFQIVTAEQGVIPLYYPRDPMVSVDNTTNCECLMVATVED